MSTGDGTVGKALDVLDRVATFGRPVRFSELLADSPHPKATLYRLLQTLCHQNMLVHDPETGHYRLGFRLVRLAHAAWQTATLAQVARPYLDQLARQTGETVHLAQLDNGQVLYVDKRNARDPVQMFSSAGKIGPAYCTGVGKAMMACLPEADLVTLISQQSFHRFTDNTLCTEAELRAELAAIRTRGFAYDREEHEPGIICVSIPILSTQGRVQGAISLTGPTARVDYATLEGFLTNIQQAASQIAAEAGAWVFPEPAPAHQQGG